jgi:hypothetical protein
VRRFWGLQKKVNEVKKVLFGVSKVELSCEYDSFEKKGKTRAVISLAVGGIWPRSYVCSSQAALRPEIPDPMTAMRLPSGDSIATLDDRCTLERALGGAIAQM